MGSDLAKTLAELSAKATQGACDVLAPDTEHDFGVPLVATNYPGTYGPTNGMVLWATMQPTEIDAKDTAQAEANAAFTAALWNAYRTGKLVALPISMDMQSAREAAQAALTAARAQESATIAALQAELAEAREVPGRIVDWLRGKSKASSGVVYCPHMLATAIEARDWGK